MRVYVVANKQGIVVRYGWFKSGKECQAMVDHLNEIEPSEIEPIYFMIQLDETNAE